MLSQFELTPQEAWDLDLMYPLPNPSWARDHNPRWRSRPTFQHFVFDDVFP